MKSRCFKTLLLIWALSFGPPSLADTGASGRRPTIHPAERYRPLASRVSEERLKETVRKLVSFRTRHTASPDTGDTEGIAAAARWLEAEMRRAAGTTPMRVEADRFVAESPRLAGPTPAVNVLAFIPAGSEWGRDRYVIVSGHYDSRASDVTDFTSDAPGANDDASGTAVVVELAHVLSGRSFDANVLLACVSAEEVGLLGSKDLAARAREEGWSVRAMITNDIVGNSTGQNLVRERNRLRVFSEGVRSTEDERGARLRVAMGGENDSPSRQLSRHAAEVIGETLDGFQVLAIFRRDRMGRGGDHIPFLDIGVPAVRFTEVNEDFRKQHQDVRTENGVAFGDLPEFMDFGYLAQVARANVAVVASLADAPAEPGNVRISAGVQVDTTLSWDPVPDGDLKGYEVLWRETSATAWQDSRFAPAGATSLTLVGITVDNHFFAVRSVDSAGNRSIAVFPKGIRAD